MAVAAHDGRIFLAGGLSPLGDALTDVEIFDPVDWGMDRGTVTADRGSTTRRWCPTASAWC